MAVFETNFYDGTGKVYINPDAGSGDATAETTADCNCGEDRTVNVAVVASSLSRKVTVNQEGVREQFIPADQEEGMMGADGDYFLGIKAEYANNLPDGCIPHIHIDQTQTDPAKMITGDVQGETITAIREGSDCFVMKPEGDSWGLYRLSKTSRTQYADGTDASADIKQYDVMMRLPEFWYRGTEGDQVDIYFKTTQPSDPENWVHWDGNVLIGCYKSNYDSINGLKSISGVDISSNISHANFKAYAEARGTGFQLVDWEMHCVMAVLFYAWYGNTNAQTVFDTGFLVKAEITGTTDPLGMTDGIAGSGNLKSVNFWGLEDWWLGYYEFMYDTITTETSILVYNPNTKEFDRDVELNYRGVGYKFVSKMKFGKYLDCIATEVNGDQNSGYCDPQAWGRNSGYPTRRSGYSTGAPPYSGLAFLETQSEAVEAVGSRLCYRGPFTIH